MALNEPIPLVVTSWRHSWTRQCDYMRTYGTFQVQGPGLERGTDKLLEDCKRSLSNARNNRSLSRVLGVCLEGCARVGSVFLSLSMAEGSGWFLELVVDLLWGPKKLEASPLDLECWRYCWFGILGSKHTPRHDKNKTADAFGRDATVNAWDLSSYSERRWQS